MLQDMFTYIQMYSMIEETPGVKTSHTVGAQGGDMAAQKEDAGKPTAATCLLGLMEYVFLASS